MKKTGRIWHALTAILVTALFGSFAFSQSADAPQQARVFTSYANVHAGSSTNDPPLVLVPEGTILPVIGRRGEWVEVGLSPELRETGMVVRWYEGRHQIIRRGQLITIGDETSGWMHDSTVEITDVETP